MEVLAKLKPAFRPDGTVTAGNACPLNDGAAAVLVMSAEKAKRSASSRRRGSSPRLSPRSAPRSWPGSDPGDPGAARAAGVKIDDVDVVEINEAFAAQIVPCKDDSGSR